jgi:hypothetical protein
MGLVKWIGLLIFLAALAPGSFGKEKESQHYVVAFTDVLDFDFKKGSLMDCVLNASNSYGSNGLTADLSVSEMEKGKSIMVTAWSKDHKRYSYSYCSRDAGTVEVVYGEYTNDKNAWDRYEKLIDTLTSEDEEGKESTKSSDNIGQTNR